MNVEALEMMGAARHAVRFAPYGRSSTQIEKGHPAQGQPFCSYVVRGLLSRPPAQARVSGKTSQAAA